MSELQIPISHTQNLINYNTLISEKTTLSAYKPKRSVSGNSAEQSMQLKKFHEYFGKIKPSLYTELKNIFENAHFDESPCSPQLEYHIQGTTLGSRANKIRQSKQRKINQSIESNNLTIESFNKKQTVRRAKISRLLEYQKGLQSQLTEQVTRNILRKSDQLLHQLKESYQAEKRTNYRSTGKSFRVSKSVVDRQSFLQWINPDRKDKFTSADLNSILGVLHQVDIQLSPMISYFNVYIQEGNNSELLKNLVRKRNGWRVVELPAIANLIWTQFYRRGLLKKRLHKRQRSQNEQERDKSLKIQAGKKVKVTSLEKKQDSLRLDLTLPKTMENSFYNQIRKLIPMSESQDLATLKKPSLCNIQSIQVTHNVLLHNHFPFNCCISDKKNLLFHLSKYLSSRGQNVFEYVPQTYQVNDLQHFIIRRFQENQGEEKDYWIVKPGQNSNRGRGITISRSKQQTLQELQRRLSQETQTRQNISQIRSRKSIIVQRYLKPLLYNGRKFDIRSYMLVTFLAGQLRMYCYEECYIRTSSKVFDINSSNRLVHLTNDAIQSHSSDYGKYEEGNKVSQQVFARFIDDQYEKKCPGSKVWNSLKAQMQERCTAVVESSQHILLKGTNPLSNDKQHFYFQLFGMDFMLDDQFKLWLIQVNTNPAITHDCSRVLSNLIPRMLDNVFAIAVEPIMKPLRLHDVVYNNQFVAVYKKNTL